ncbi:MAG: BACON domain-containing carbohydrate-binding protein [Porphyromonas sp.]|uniref:BACON domain-containing carbohydrate-binding protein n=1 Tax=Porphyromonas sp. TaxID=1924944 RepID=UPI002A90F9C9|nr:BACON domain-containing carbohydrate-binding protein [Porphyromonas sp.]MDD7469008.1 BACON domain-containing carbohydrate-binding protein [Bacteroidales bacterium]MDY6102103.1 BACON domain-containing carbohydrate-binding protein [Porphyromonas sp.]
MKHHYLWVLSVCFLLFLVYGCDDTSQTPEIKQKVMEFDRTGGTKVNEVILKKNPWFFHTLVVYEQDPSATTVNKVREKELTKEEMEISTTKDGDKVIHYDWITFCISKDTRTITVTAEENKTGQPRSIHFVAWSKVWGPSFTVKQKE